MDWLCHYRGPWCHGERVLDTHGRVRLGYFCIKSDQEFWWWRCPVQEHTSSQPRGKLFIQWPKMKWNFYSRVCFWSRKMACKSKAVGQPWLQMYVGRSISAGLASKLDLRSTLEFFVSGSFSHYLAEKFHLLHTVNYIFHDLGSQCQCIIHVVAASYLSEFDSNEFLKTFCPYNVDLQANASK